MPQADHQNFIIYIFIGIVAIVILFFLAVRFACFLNAFSEELKYLNFEIQRTEGAERQIWEDRKKELWHSLFPFGKYK